MDWRALGIAVVRRRVELGYDTRKAFVAEHALGERNLSDIENSRRESYDAGYLARLERALHWPPGTVDAILSGESTPATIPPDDAYRELAEIVANMARTGGTIVFGVEPTDEERKALDPLVLEAQRTLAAADSDKELSRRRGLLASAIAQMLQEPLPARDALERATDLGEAARAALLRFVDELQGRVEPYPVHFGDEEPGRREWGPGIDPDHPAPPVPGSLAKNRAR